jgi:hypothetical protein
MQEILLLATKPKVVVKNGCPSKDSIFLGKKIVLLLQEKSIEDPEPF